MNDTPKRFEDWEEVDCNECARYWDSSCDSVPQGSHKPCNAFLATRSIVLPAKINALEKRIKWLEWALLIGFIIIGLLLIVGEIL